MLSTSIYLQRWCQLRTFKTVLGVKTALLHHVVPKQTMFRTARSSAQSRAPIRSNSIRSSPIESNVPQDSIPLSNLYKAFAFTGAFGLSCFLGATVLEYENTRSMMIDRARQAKTIWSRYKLNNQNMWDEKKKEMTKLWNELRPSDKMFIPICALNVMAFGLWRVPTLRPFMTTYFCSNPAARAVAWPMVLSTFSHYSPMHLFANMYVLHSFSGPCVSALGKEQFLAVYLTAGVFSSFVSYGLKFLTSTPGLSLGASGAIMAILAFVCATYPDTQLSILFLPMYTFSAGVALKCIMGLDIAGCLMGWTFFDHAAHLGGALFGLFWAYYGKEVWALRLPFLTKYHDWRRTKH